MAVDPHWEEGDPVPEGYVQSQEDGLLAREQGPWAKKKLDFLKDYLPAAVKATKKLRGHTYYLDLFAGPGRNVWTNRSQEFPGSPLIALSASCTFEGEAEPTGFSYLHFCNIDGRDHRLLGRRVEWERGRLEDKIRLGNVELHHGDANKLVSQLIENIPRFAFIAAFADIEGPTNLPFATVEALRARHDRVDLYVLFPSSDLERLLCYDPEKRERNAKAVTTFFGTDAWRGVVEQRQTDGQAVQMRRGLLALYKDQLGHLWKHVDDEFRVKGPRGYYYHMVFATNHEAGDSIAQHVAKGGQQELDL